PPSDRRRRAARPPADGALPARPAARALRRCARRPRRALRAAAGTARPAPGARVGSAGSMTFEAPRFDLTQEELSDTAVVIRVDGEIHATTAPEFSERIHGAIDGGKTGVVLDLTGVEFIDSTGLSVLLNSLRRVTRARGAMVLAC